MQDERHFLHLGYFEGKFNAIYSFNADVGHSPSWLGTGDCGIRAAGLVNLMPHSNFAIARHLLYHNAVHERSSCGP